MGLDIYVGSFTRYHSGNWETIVARMAREQGLGFETIRTQPEPSDKVSEPALIHQAVEAWRMNLEKSLRPHFSDSLQWNERLEAEYFTDKPDWTGYWGAVLLAAHVACPEIAPPTSIPQQIDQDAAYKKLSAEKFRCRFSQLFDVEIWLPCDFGFRFHATDITGNDAGFGSSITLLAQLKQLNDETYKADQNTLAKWRLDGAGPENSFAQCSQFGLAMFMLHAQLSVEHRLPMKLDY